MPRLNWENFTFYLYFGKYSSIPPLLLASVTIDIIFDMIFLFNKLRITFKNLSFNTLYSAAHTSGTILHIDDLDQQEHQTCVTAVAKNRKVIARRSPGHIDSRILVLDFSIDGVVRLSK